MQRDHIRVNNATPEDVRVGAIAPGDFLKRDATTGEIVGGAAGGGGLTQAQALTLVSYRG